MYMFGKISTIDHFQERNRISIKLKKWGKNHKKMSLELDTSSLLYLGSAKNECILKWWNFDFTSTINDPENHPNLFFPRKPRNIDFYLYFRSFSLSGRHLKSTILNFKSYEGFIRSNPKNLRIYIFTNIIVVFHLGVRHIVSAILESDNEFIISDPENPRIYIFTNIFAAFYFAGRHLESGILSSENLITYW